MSTFTRIDTDDGSDAHIPVLLEEILTAFDKRKLINFVDGTVGGGGHAEALLAAHPEITRYLAIDRDPRAIERVRIRLDGDSSRVYFSLGNFADLERHLASAKIELADGMLFDFGLSSYQLAEEGRGLSFTRDEPLDMRMDPGEPLTAAEVVNHWSEQQLAELFRDIGEERRWRQAARAIVLARRKKPFRSTGQLVQLLLPLIGRGRWQKRHPLTRLFQALRIAVNGELKAIESLLPLAIERLKEGGLLAAISFHSLEDRLVKQAFRKAAKEGRVSLLTKKPQVPTQEEIRANPRSRSAKLRVLEKR